MKRLSSKIIIGQFNSDGSTGENPLQIDFVTDINIESTWENLTDSGSLVIPRKVIWRNKPIVNGANSIFKRGQSIYIYLGYDGDFKIVFSGFISDVSVKNPVEIFFEDEMWVLKQRIIENKSWRQVSLSELMKYLMKGTQMPYRLLGDVNLTTSEASIKEHSRSKLYKEPYMPQFSINNATVAQVLESLKKDYGIYAFMRYGTLYVGLPYVPSLREEAKFKFGVNIISDNLIYRKIDDVKLKVRAISIDAFNKRITKDVGDPQGDIRTLHFYGLNEADLIRAAETELDRLKYEGFVGDFESFGEPLVNHGDGVVFIHPKLPESTGTYLVKKVTRYFGIRGYRQNIELGAKI